MIANQLLDTPLLIVPGMDDQEIHELWLATFARAKMTQRFLDREIDVETYFDFMAEQGIEPEELLDTAEENFQFVINHGLTLEI